MDERSRKDWNRYIRDGDPYAHARVIKRAMQSKHLNVDRLALCAYLKDPACELLFSDFVRAGCFLYFEHAMKNYEPKDIIPHIRKWGTEATILAACGVIKCNLTSKSTEWSANINKMAKFAHTYKIAKPFFPKQPSLIGELVSEELPIPRRFSLLEKRLIRTLTQEILWGIRIPGISTLKVANAELDDDKLMRDMLFYIKPWALKEYM